MKVLKVKPVAVDPSRRSQIISKPAKLTMQQNNAVTAKGRHSVLAPATNRQALQVSQASQQPVNLAEVPEGEERGYAVIKMLQK